MKNWIPDPLNCASAAAADSDFRTVRHRIELKNTQATTTLARIVYDVKTEVKERTGAFLDLGFHSYLHCSRIGNQ
jgi:hypothetical protein